MRRLRERTWREGLVDAPTRWGLRFWAMAARRPALYRLASRWAVRSLKFWSRGRGAMASLPFGGAFTRSRDFPAPEGDTFMDRYRRGER